MTEAPERTLFVVNPKSAGGRTRKDWPAIEALAREILGSVSTRLTERQGHATELAAQAIQEGYDLIVSVGGDGTNNEVLNGFFDDAGELRNNNVAFGFLPRGTGCDLARTFDLSGDPREGLERLANKEIMIDVGRVTFTGHDGKPGMRHFINVSGFGANGDVVERVNRSSKKLGGFATFALATVKSLASYNNKRVAYSFDDGEETIERINTMFVCNARFAGGGMIVGPKAKMDDGLFDITLIGDIGKARALMNGRLLYSGKIYDAPEVTHHRARRIKARPLDTGFVLLDLDGEQPGRLPATFEVLPQVLRVRA